MNIKAVGYYIGHVLRLIAVMMLPALLIAFFGREEGTVLAFALSMGITMAAGCLMFLLKRPGEGGVRPVEGFITVSLSWILISLFGALPFYISGQIPRFIDCFFETVSGFTTTGASILPEYRGAFAQPAVLALIYALDRRHGRTGVHAGHSSAIQGQRRKHAPAKG